MYTPLLRSLLTLLHLAPNLYAALRYAWHAVQLLCVNLVLRCAAIATSPVARELDALARTLQRVSKVPQHLVIVHGPHEQPPFLDYVRIIRWCIALDVPYISFFDRNGFLKRNEIKFRKEFAKKWPDLVEYITWNSYTKEPSQNGINGRKITVSFLSDIDGRRKIITLIQSLAVAISLDKLNESEITDQLITEKLRIKEIPDPDLALIRDCVYSTSGLLPWQTRTTEFLMLPPYNSITVNDFTYLLERFSKCVQRYGK